jgi:CDP-diacylglycerol--serine O-phosphatidyltransferase
MVSRVRYFSFKEFGFVRSHPYQTMVATLLVASMIFSMPRLFCFLILMGYIISGPAYTLYLKRKGKTFDPEAADAAKAAE